MFRSLLGRVALAAIATLTVAVADARADFQWRITTTGAIASDTGVMNFGGNPGTFSGTYGGVVISGSEASWSTSPVLGQLLSDSLHVHNNNTTAITLTIMVTVNNLSAPPSPLVFNSHFAGTWGTFSAGSSTSASSYFNSNNALFGTTTPLNHSTMNATAAFSQDLVDGQVSYNPNYSLTQIITITLNGTGGVIEMGGDLQFTLRTELLPVPPVPEPATLASALFGLPMLGGYFWRRRKSQSATA